MTKKQTKKPVEIKKLPKPAKVAATKALSELDFTQQQIAEILGIGERSVFRYLREETDERWRAFGENIKKLIRIKEEEIAAKCLAQIEEKMPKAKFYELVGLYKTIRELQKPTTPLVAQQFGNITYVIQTTKDEKEFIDATSKTK